MMRGQKFDSDYVKGVYEKKGCILLEEYKSSTTPMQYKCKCGNISRTSFSNFQRSGQCTSCAGCRKRTTQDVKEIFAKYGCELLSEYQNKKDKLTFRCKCGNIATTYFQNFKRPNNHHCCRECWRKSFSGENNYNWNPDRVFLKTKQVFHRRCASLLWNVLNKLGLEKNANKKKLLGYSSEELRLHLMQHPNWERVKNQDWEIDHVFPVSAFARMGIFDLQLINCLENLQPLESGENKTKAGKYDHVGFLLWLESKGINFMALQPTIPVVESSLVEPSLGEPHEIQMPKLSFGANFGRT